VSHHCSLRLDISCVGNVYRVLGTCVSHPTKAVQGKKQVDVSAWHLRDLACTNYSAEKAQFGICNHRACSATTWDKQPSHRTYHSVFSSGQPRLVALPTGRSNDSKLATSLWGDSNREHYSGEMVGPGSHHALNLHFLDPKNKVIPHACCIKGLDLPENLKASKQVSIPELVHRCYDAAVDHACVTRASSHMSCSSG
jgi:hypothetical protein